MAVMNIVQAVNSALDAKLADDENVLVFGEDAGYEGGVFRVTEGLQKKYGDKRVFDTPLAESVIIGAGIGMAANGLRPVCEMQFSGFMYPAFNQIISHVGRMRLRSRGTYSVPMVIRAPYGGGIRALEHHSESAEAIYGHIPGIKVVIPSTPYDAKGLLISAIEDNDPVIFLEPKKIYRAIKQEVPEELYRIKIGKAKVLQEGTQLTVVAYGAMIRTVQQALQHAKKEGLSIELIDLRTIYPLDKETVMDSVKKTGRLLVVHEAVRKFGVAAELIALANEEAFLHLEAPPARVTGFDTVVPLPKGEDFYFPTADRIYEAIRKTVDF
ncbi:MAG: alpha-ketoacid dehydrogenase subunit beta [candidate division Zixibacteria bacterium]|nr:alpha-ketoacid dehydrogenase subunit beta [candidate division Zixibacteria bacterium]MBU1469998.1 alpha-ketoacid dehydrogenase subunit beta [candidate division Zixibacteria bacterium]MBU2626178.1 alpha-ketoacid dehydrogenase subunit beta [candidate division Zixibacteria bacterium]